MQVRQGTGAHRGVRTVRRFRLCPGADTVPCLAVVGPPVMLYQCVYFRVKIFTKLTALG